ncbi:CDP-diacylglycerol--glycerol-3-phosphate 3-phosphatidyltransferase [Nocardioides cavernae]|uniref:CDP-diacylglycerol--glycerol-3-phosphate 3-phosphatidyltransferase n=1 Tax=Nocardioides cavernae TaxID=1921566 RepID=A0A7Y9H3U1_9ACTN|nr:CDP-alcohol phosphatidyltransferase family protein [Nocardioides cavernae]NYE37415.1 CDP-diacylglycerol--glycerol-3-phosphate 3-phosphatidyltransferase [Nocardioides cavernae]
MRAEPVAQGTPDPEGRYGVREERLLTGATVVTAVRTVASVVLAAMAAHQQDLTLLVVALVVYWVGDMLDGFYARVRDCETRIGAVLDIMCDRLNAAAFYIGLAWLQPDLSPAIFVYLAEFMVVDCFLSIAFLAWPIRSPNYFFVVDRPIWLWNWSKPAKAVNSALFAVLLLVTGWMWVGLAIATALLVLKCVSLHRLTRIGLPVPGAVG